MITLQIPTRLFNESYLFLLREPFRSVPTQILYGGGGSGKSVFIAQRDILDMMNEERNFLCIRNTANTLRTSVFEERRKVINTFNLAPLFDIKESDLTITYKPNRTVILFRGLDDPEKLKSITTPVGTLTDIRYEEATEMSEQAIEEVGRRMRGLTSVTKREVFSFNPIFRTHWICRKYFAGQNIAYRNENDVLIFHSTYRDNKFLTEQDRKRYIGYTQYQKDVYSDGKWGVLGDIIFTNWEVQNLLGLEFDTRRNGLDFGFTSGVSALCQCAVRAAEKTIYIVKETYDRGMTNLQLADRLKPIIGSDLLWCDSAEPKSIQELRMYGLNAQPVKKGKDSVYHSIQWLQQWKLVIDKRCISFQNEISQYQWQKNKEGENIQQPTGEDHLIDALRYATERDRSYDVPKISVG